MPIGTISDTTWAAASPPSRKATVSTRAYRLSGARHIFVAAELATVGGLLTFGAAAGTGVGAAVVIVCCALFFHLLNLDRSLLHADLADFCSDVATATFSGLAVAWPVFLAFPALAPPTNAAIAGGCLAAALPLSLMVVLRHPALQQHLHDGVLLVGSGELVGKLSRALAHAGTSVPEPVIRLCGRSEGDAAAEPALEFNWLRDPANRDGVSRLIVAERAGLTRSRLAAGLIDSEVWDLRISDAGDFFESRFRKIWIETLSPEWFVNCGGFSRSKPAAAAKRACDILCGLILLVLTAPLMLIVAAAIKLDSRGPVLFRQVRVGLHGAEFTMYKFRSMLEDAESDGNPRWAADGDSRITGVGRFLRRSRLDELPQILNVLRGDMSLVGPRPERPYFVDWLREAIPYYSLRHCVKPGITGWAQVNYPYGDSIEDAREKLQYDLYYIKHGSLRCDPEILLRTVKTVLLGEGR